MWPDLAIYCTLGNFWKPVATIILPKMPTFLENFWKGVKIISFFKWNNFGQLFQHSIKYYSKRYRLLEIQYSQIFIFMSCLSFSLDLRFGLRLPEQLCLPLLGDPGDDLHRSGKWSLFAAVTVDAADAAVAVDSKLERDACREMLKGL